jgi:D-glycero-D-manno-heptose 1,7-bisphosphate phosphatase
VADSSVPAVLLDRDGVINRRRVDHVKTWSEFEFLPGVLQALAVLHAMETRVVVITNQGAVGRGLLSAPDLDRIHARMARAVRAAGGQLDGIYACPHAPNEGCTCRKPAPTLFYRASADLGIRLNGSIFVGDSPSDVQAARAAGCRPVLIDDNKVAVDQDVIAVKSLGEAVTVWRDLVAPVGSRRC